MTELQRTQLKIAENHFNRSKLTRQAGLKRTHEICMWQYLLRALEPA